MSKFEWMELETLNTEIAHLQSRVDAARAAKNSGMVRLLEREMAEVADRRNLVLAGITVGLNVVPPAGQQPGNILVDDTQPRANEEHRPAPTIDAGDARNPTSAEPAQAVTPTGDISMWDKLTATDLERVKRGLATRRSEMLARHTQELKALEAEQNEIDIIEKAIAAFAQKFNPTRSAEVLVLDKGVPAQAG